MQWDHKGINEGSFACRRDGNEFEENEDRFTNHAGREESMNLKTFINAYPSNPFFPRDT